MNLTVLFETRYLPYIRRHLKPKTVAEYERLICKAVLPRLGDRPLATLTLDDAEALHADTPGLIQANRAVTYLSGMLTYAVEHRLLAVHPCRGVRRNPEKGREFFYTPDQTRALLEAVSGWPDIRAKYVALELLTGVRPGELLDSGPEWRRNSVLRTPDGKTGGRTIYLPDAACAILDGLQPVARDVRVWVQGRGWQAVQRVCYFPSEMDLRRAWAHLCRAAGVPRARLYDLRHTFASAALAAGQSLDVISQLLGHRKVQTTRRYAHLAPDTALNAAAVAAARMGA